MRDETQTSEVQNTTGNEVEFLATISRELPHELIQDDSDKAVLSNMLLNAQTSQKARKALLQDALNTIRRIEHVWIVLQAQVITPPTITALHQDVLAVSAELFVLSKCGVPVNDLMKRNQAMYGRIMNWVQQWQSNTNNQQKDTNTSEVTDSEESISNVSTAMQD